MGILALLLFATAFRADEVELSSGTIVEGKVQDLGDSIKIVKSNGSATYPKSMIRKITPKKTVEEIYEEKSRELQEGDLDGHLKLGRWCAEKKLQKEAVAEFRKVIEVQGNNLVMRSPLNSGIKVNKGDKIEIEASGSVVMTPWGSDQVSGPEGSPNYGQYRPGINGGALCMRYGASGQDELIGRGKKFTATKSGTIYFGVAMQQNFAGTSSPAATRSKCGSARSDGRGLSPWA